MLPISEFCVCEGGGRWGGLQVKLSYSLIFSTAVLSIHLPWTWEVSYCLLIHLLSSFQYFVAIALVHFSLFFMVVCLIKSKSRV